MPIDLDAVTRTLAPVHLRSIVESTARLNIWQGSVRSGKTVSSLLRFLMAVAVAPTSGRILVFGKTRESVYRNIFSVLMDPALFGPLALLTTYNQGAATATILGREVDVLGANDAKAEPKVRGMTLVLAYGDELTTIPEEFFVQVLARLSVKGAQLFGTTNPDSRNHWLRVKYLLRQGELNLRTWHSTIDDNPHLDPDYVRDIKTEYTGLWYKRFILGEWCLAEGAIFESWDEDLHVVDELPRIVRWPATGIDYGTTNPFAALALGVGEDKRLYLTDEYRWDSKKERKQLTDAEYAKALLKWHRTPRPWLGGMSLDPEWWAVDPSAASFKVQLFRDGINRVMDADNDVLSGIRMVASLLATDRLRVHRRCAGFIEEAPGYSWDDEKAEKGEDAPVKADDHSLDGARYAIATTESLWRPLIRDAYMLAA